MHGLTGSQVPRNWRTDDLLRVGDDLRHQRNARANGAADEVRPPGLRGRIGLYLIGVGQTLAGEARRRQPCPDAAPTARSPKPETMTRATRPQ
jgi:hypothetical protein